MIHIYFISSILADKGSLNKNEIYEIICNKYQVTTLNYSKFDAFLTKFNVSNHSYFLDIFKTNYWYETQECKEHISKYLTYSEEELFKLLNAIVNSKKVNIFEGIKIVFAIDKKRNDKDLSIYEAKIYNILLDIDLIAKNIMDIIAKIDISYYELPLDLILKDKLVLDILFINGINTIKDLLSLSSDILILTIKLILKKYLKKLNQNILKF